MVDIYNNRSYELLKNATISNQLAQLKLEEIKCMFRNEIRSNRNMDRINTVKDLVDYLERNDSLSASNIEPLREIADHCGGDLERSIVDYISPRETLTGRNIYREQRFSEEFRNKLEVNSGHVEQTAQTATTNCHDKFLKFYRQHDPSSFEKKRIDIYKLITSNIGHSWRSLGRELDISQGTMDAIEVQYPNDLNSRVQKMLKVFEEDVVHDPNRRILQLCRALEACRRKDLRRKVEDMMSYK
uniref:Death domain-containing protein n=1 Tax=Glossina austeni TaxID=7395 RepID=A0A1A9UGD4_GLOAU